MILCLAGCMAMSLIVMNRVPISLSTSRSSGPLRASSVSGLPQWVQDRWVFPMVEKGEAGFNSNTYLLSITNSFWDELKIQK